MGINMRNICNHKSENGKPTLAYNDIYEMRSRHMHCSRCGAEGSREELTSTPFIAHMFWEGVGCESVAAEECVVAHCEGDYIVLEGVFVAEPPKVGNTYHITILREGWDKISLTNCEVVCVREGKVVVVVVVDAGRHEHRAAVYAANMEVVRESMKNTSDCKEESGNNTVTNLPCVGERQPFTEKPISLPTGGVALFDVPKITVLDLNGSFLCELDSLRHVHFRQGDGHLYVEVEDALLPVELFRREGVYRRLGTVEHTLSIKVGCRNRQEEDAHIYIDIDRAELVKSPLDGLLLDRESIGESVEYIWKARLEDVGILGPGE